MNRAISWIAYLCLLLVEEIEEAVFDLFLAGEALQHRFDFDYSSKLLSQGGVRAPRKEVI